jgi:hypothetical protein
MFSSTWRVCFLSHRALSALAKTDKHFSATDSLKDPSWNRIQNEMLHYECGISWYIYSQGVLKMLFHWHCNAKHEKNQHWGSLYCSSDLEWENKVRHFPKKWERAGKINELPISSYEMSPTSCPKLQIRALPSIETTIDNYASEKKGRNLPNARYGSNWALWSLQLNLRNRSNWHCNYGGKNIE